MLKISKTKQHMVDSILKRLDVSAGLDEKHEAPNGGSERHRMRIQDVRMEVEHPGGTKSDLLVHTQFVSTHEIGLVSPGYIHVGTSCEIHLPTTEESHSKTFKTTVLQCEYEEDGWHSAILAIRKTIETSRTTAQTVDTDYEILTLRSPAIAISSNEATLRLLDLFVQKHGCECVLFDSVGPAYDLLASNSYELVVFDLAKDTYEVEPILKKLCDTGHRLVIILIIPADMQEPKCDKNVIIHRHPVDPNKIIKDARNRLDAMHRGDGSATKSVYNDQSDMADLLAWYREHVSIKLARALKAIRLGQINEVIDACLEIRQTALGFGYKALSESASEVLTTCYTFGLGDETEESFDELCELGRSLT